MKRGLPRLARSDLALLLATAAVVLAIAWAALPSRPASFDDRARAIETQLRCVTCQGLSIADSPATSAAQMRSVVREQLAAGASDDEVRAFFVARYGRWILLDPPAAGPDLALWLAPAVILAGGALLVARRVRAPQQAGAAKWSARLPVATSQVGTLAIGAAMLLALAVPIAVAVGPRLMGREVSGGPVAPAAGPSIADLEAFVSAQPDDADALVALGDALLTAERPAEAADRYRAALEINKNNVGALVGIGAILLKAGRADVAIGVFDRALAVSPDQPDALVFGAAARVRLAGGMTDQARRGLERFLAVAPAADPRRDMAAQLLTASPATPEASFTGSPPASVTP